MANNYERIKQAISWAKQQMDDYEESSTRSSEEDSIPTVKVSSARCPKCGATLLVKNDISETYCTNCGEKLALEQENERIIALTSSGHKTYIKRQASITLCFMLVLTVSSALLFLAIAQFGSGRTWLGIYFISIALVELVYCLFQSSADRQPSPSHFFYRCLILCIFSVSLSFGIWLLIQKKLDWVLVVIIWFFSSMMLYAAFDALDDSYALNIEGTKVSTDTLNIQEGRIKYPAFTIEYSKTDYVALKSQLESVGYTNIRTTNLRDLWRKTSKKYGTVDQVTVNGKRAENGVWYKSDAEFVITYHGCRRDR